MSHLTTRNSHVSLDPATSSSHIPTHDTQALRVPCPSHTDTRTYTNTSANTCTHVRIRTYTRPQLGHTSPIPAHVPRCRTSTTRQHKHSLLTFAHGTQLLTAIPTPPFVASPTHTFFAITLAFLFKTPPPSPTHNTRTGTDSVQTLSKPHHFGVDSV